jgi:hypothetical protein
MQVFVSGRQTGKTHLLAEWAKNGTRVDSYPGWSRIILTTDLREADRLRGPGNPFGLDYHQVFSVTEWRNGRFRFPDLQVGVDNIDIVLAGLLRSRVDVGTITGLEWKK